MGSMRKQFSKEFKAKVAFEALKGLETTGSKKITVLRLAELYTAGDNGGSPDPIDIGGITWSYIAGDLPGYEGHVIGDSWTMLDGKYYIYLGSGLEGGGEVPEPSTLGLLAFGALGILAYRRKQKKKGHRYLCGSRNGDTCA
ncbi:MAG: PEP-CTERM sorting domain-containing protein [Candidatus Ancaeobacter aquaticus]|nr:PEP-CTERM sorting domain-containing protein [Candidatus Ancaeobacter aquaticus]